jgi:hypothetical protein
MPKIIKRAPPSFDSVFDWDAALRQAKEHLRAEFKKESAANKKPPEPDRVYRLKELMEITGLKKSAIYQAIQHKQLLPSSWSRKRLWDDYRLCVCK